MEWLLSPAAEGIGQQLLHKARDVNGLGAPVTITLSKKEETHYDHYIHEVILNLDDIKKTVLPNKNGVLVPFALESVLAHELTHAGELEAETEHLNRMTEIESEVEEAIWAKHPLKKKAAEVALENIANARDRETAIDLLMRYIDDIIFPFHKEMHRELSARADYMAIMTTVEKPAVDMENKVAILLGNEPLRTSYLTDSPGDRQMILDELIREHGINLLPSKNDAGAAAENSGWAATTQGVSERKEHPLIARHKNDGKMF